MTIRFRLNGRPVEVDAEPRRLLADVLREDLGMTSIHLGCEHGVCGACTILFEGQPARSCLLFGVQADGATVRTVEGLAQDGALHPIQRAFIDQHALQCGFCTPGFLMTGAWLVEEGRPLDRQTIREALSGNLCRCTGYQQIVNAVEQAMREAPSG